MFRQAEYGCHKQGMLCLHYGIVKYYQCGMRSVSRLVVCSVLQMDALYYVQQCDCGLDGGQLERERYYL